MKQIPKKIHYCWFGRNPKSKLVEKCISSWKSMLPDYEIIEWNEDNFDMNSNKYLMQAYKSKKWAFVSDYVRISVLNLYGGIYLDTDVEVIKKFDNLLDNKGFIGLESLDNMVTGVLTATIGSVSGNPILEEILSKYETRDFVINGKEDLTTNVIFITELLVNKYNLLLENKIQKINNDFIVYTSDYFCPKNSCTKLKLTPNTYSIHHFDGSWVPISTKIKSSISYHIKKFIKKS